MADERDRTATTGKDATEDASARHGRPGRGPYKSREHETTGREVTRTWVILGLMMLAYIVWFGVIYLLEPGIR